MKNGKTNGKSVVIIGLVLLVAVLAMWVLADTLYSVGLFIGAGIAIGGLILMMNEKKKAA